MALFWGYQTPILVLTALLRVHSLCIRQNAALFWWNLHRNGAGAGATLHAACPVLAGDKWGEALG